MPMVKDGHLGGFVNGGDPRCHYPEMWDKLIKDFGIKSVIDIGCGQGQALEHFKNKGVEGLGIDGSKLVLDNAVFEPIIIHDYTSGPYIPEKIYDLAWCCEFVEHIEEQHAGNFIATFQKAKLVAMSHALPGQGGYHHVNENTDEYWIKKMEDAGFLFARHRTDFYRTLAHDYFMKSGLIFINKNL